MPKAALTVIEHDVGWVVAPGKADELANAVVFCSKFRRSAEGCATEIARRIDFNTAMALLRLDPRALAKEAGLAARWLPAREAVQQHRRRGTSGNEK